MFQIFFIIIPTNPKFVREQFPHAYQGEGGRTIFEVGMRGGITFLKFEGGGIILAGKIYPGQHIEHFNCSVP